MSNITSSNKFLSALFLPPVLWMSTGMLWDGDGDMRLVPIVLVIVALSLFLFRFDVVKDNFGNSFWIKLLIVNAIFGSVAYKVYGFDSRELRATFTMLFLFLSIPKGFYTVSNIQWFSFLSSLSCLSYGYYYQFISVLGRASWPVNAIPFATICGMVALLSLGLLVSSFECKNRTIVFLSFVFSLLGLIASQSRGPLIAAITVVIVFLSFFVYKKRNLVLMMFMSVLFILLCGLYKVPVIKERIEWTISEYNLIQEGDYSSPIGIRLQMLQVASELWIENPVLGYGKNIKSEFDHLEKEGRITTAVNKLISMTFHNGYVDKFVLYGGLGGVVFLTFIIYPIWKARKYSIDRGATLLWPPAVFIAMCNLSDAPFINAQAAIYYMFIIGAVTMMLSNEKERE